MIRRSILEREINILRDVHHKNIVKLSEVYEDDLNVYLVLDYANGGDLYEDLNINNPYNERKASAIAKDVLEGLAYLHSKGIIHRDIKLENLLIVYDIDYHYIYRNHEGSSTIKISDFGLATQVDPNELETQRCGSPGYAAPELLAGVGYDTKADIFSVGVILYILYQTINIIHAG